MKKSWLSTLDLEFYSQTVTHDMIFSLTSKEHESKLTKLEVINQTQGTLVMELPFHTCML